MSDRIGIIRRGSLVAEGTIDDLRHKIQGIRSIAIRLTREVDEEQLQAKLDKLKSKFPVEVKRDILRNTISFAQPQDRKLVRSLYQVLGWLEEEQIQFSRFATSEPNLEEVFLAVASTAADVDDERLSEGEVGDEFK